MSRRRLRIIVRMTPRSVKLLCEIAAGNVRNARAMSAEEPLPDTVREPWVERRAA
jgi:hypothetical protein